MNNKNINIKIIILVFCFMVFISNNNKNVKSLNDSANVYLIFDRYEYSENDIVKLTINLDRFAMLNEVKLRIVVNNEYLEPIKNDNEYFNFNYASIYNKYVINDYVDNRYLRFHLIKENNLLEGYYSGLKNNLCEISFYVKKNITDIRKIILEEDVSLYLFDINDSVINYNIHYSDKIKIKLDKKQYDLDVFSNLPSFVDEIEVLNRNNDEYNIYIEQNVDINKIGIQVLLLAVYDIKNADYEIVPVTLNIVDRICPVIECDFDFVYLDSEFENKTFLENVIISDNYSSSVSIELKYYNYDYEIMEKSSFYDYLKHNNIGYIKIKCFDQSGNINETEYIKIEIIDKTKPILNIIDSISVIDNDVESFDIMPYLTLYDEYDDNPSLFIEYYDLIGNSVNDIKEYLSKGMNVLVKCYAVDKFNNKSDAYECVINVIDLTKPRICNVSDLVINDKDIYNTNFFKGGYIVDNFDKDLELISSYYINEIEVTNKEFLELLSKGNNGIIVYYTVDKSNNISEKVIQHIEVKDTTIPNIVVNNIENDGKYVKVDYIDYVIEDNFDLFEQLKIEVLLNDSIYNKEEITTPGEYKLSISVSDKSGNLGLFELHFTIIENNVIGCGTDVKCYYNNYSELIIVIACVSTMIVAVVIGQLIISGNKKKGKNNSRLNN